MCDTRYMALWLRFDKIGQKEHSGNLVLHNLHMNIYAWMPAC